MLAIVCKYIPATNTKGARIKASTDGHSVTIAYPHERSDGDDKYRAAAEALCKKLGWTHRMVGGFTGKAWVFCFVPD